MRSGAGLIRPAKSVRPHGCRVECPKLQRLAASRRSNVDYPAADECVLGLKSLADIAAADKWRLQRHDLSRGSTRDDDGVSGPVFGW